jgi:hypothetical protein
MLIFIDTNIFFNNWYLKSANFRLLANFANNTGATLLISDVVCQEVESKFRLERDKLCRELEKSLRRASDFQRDPASDIVLSFDHNYSFRDILLRNFNSIEFVPYENIPHSLIVERAISVIRPFRDSEKGYRDTLIWLSLLGHLQKFSGEVGQLCFLNANHSDFMENSSTNKLHAHLEVDWNSAALPFEFKCYKSLNDFVKEVIDSGLHKVSHEEFQDEMGDVMEDLGGDMAIKYLQSMPISEVHFILENAGLPRKCVRHIYEFSVEDIEGIEYPEILLLSSQNDDSIYVRCQFELLTVVYTFKVSMENYLYDLEEFEKYFINVEIDDRVASMQLLCRGQCKVGFFYKHERREFAAASVDEANLKLI